LAELAIETQDLTRTFTRYVFKKYATYSVDGNPGAFLQWALYRFSKDVTKENVVALDHLNLKVARGELTGLLGPNGSGKTTLLKVLATILHPSEGTAWIMGHDLVKEPKMIPRVLTLIPGLLSGGAWINPSLTARKNLEFYAGVFSLDRTRVDEALKVAGLSEVADSRVATFSTGMFARLSLATGLLKETPLYLMDEPTLGISPDIVRDIHAYLRDLCKHHGATIVYATHHVQEAQEMCDRVAILDSGRVMAYDTPRNLITTTRKGDVIEIELLNLSTDLIEGMEKIGDVERVLGTLIDPVDGRGMLRIHAKESRAVLPEVVEACTKRGCRILFVKVLEPDLEDVFIERVGRRIRFDASDEAA